MSLREALAKAYTDSGNDFIEFDPALFAAGPDTIVTTSTLTVNSNVIINGPGAKLLTIDGTGATRLQRRQLSPPRLRGLTITGGGNIYYYPGRRHPQHGRHADRRKKA